MALSSLLQEVALGAGLFTGIILLLALCILAARMRLLPTGNVTLLVNDERQLTVAPGGKLLSTLTAQGLFLPSACGGGGTCGQCRVIVLEGGGAALPTEATHISRHDRAAGTRLACQVNVMENMVIRVPEDVFGVQRWEATVQSSRCVATFIKELVIALPAGEHIRFRAGGYILVECPPHELAFADVEVDEAYRDDWERYRLFELRSRVTQPVTRAYSLANYPAEDDIVMLNVRIATPPPTSPGVPPGAMSSYLFSLKPGDRLLLRGPYGEFFVRDSAAEIVFIGGGAGMAPMRSHIYQQLLGLGTQRQISFWYGARSLREAFYVEAFNTLAREHDNFDWHLALSEPLADDRWTGPTGFIHEVLYDQYLARHPAPEECEYYLCGPPMMNAAVIAMLDGLGVNKSQIFLDDFGG